VECVWCIVCVWSGICVNVCVWVCIEWYVSWQFFFTINPWLTQHFKLLNQLGELCLVWKGLVLVFVCLLGVLFLLFGVV